jgi:hypothetical protein
MRLPSDNHRESGYEAFEPGVVEVVAQRLDGALDPVDSPVAALGLSR